MTIVTAELPTIRAGVGRNFYLLLKDETIDSDENIFISSETEWGVRDATVKGRLVNRGYIRAKKILVDGGKVIIDGGTIVVDGGLV